MGHRFKSDYAILRRAKGSAMEPLSQEEDEMHRSHRYFLSSLFLTAALVAPSAMSAAPRRQDNGRQEDNRRDDKDHNNNRVYDRSHKDYHNWDDGEDRAYRGYLEENHRSYRPIAEMNSRTQRAYWNWRHSHPDHDHNGR